MANGCDRVCQQIVSKHNWALLNVSGNTFNRDITARSENSGRYHNICPIYCLRYRPSANAACCCCCTRYYYSRFTAWPMLLAVTLLVEMWLSVDQSPHSLSLSLSLFSPVV